MSEEQRILVVEDSATYAAHLRVVFEENDWQVAVSSSAEEALEEVPRYCPHLVVVDYHLPGVGGDELCRQLRMRVETRTIPIVMVTGTETAGMEQEVFESGADDFILKSADREHLVLRARNLLRQCDSHGALLRNAELLVHQARVLVIEDSPTYLAHLREELENEPYRLESASDPGAALRLLERVVGTVKHMGRLIEDLLDYARLKASKESVSVRLDEVVDSALQNLACELERAGARVVRDPLPAVRGDATDLVRLFQNLVSNAVKFHAEDPPRIHLGFEEVDGEQRFCVRDNGIGIDPAQHERVFAPFKRLARDLTGTGIGLAACRRIVERTGGRIWIDSSPGRGTEVRFTLAPRGGGADRGPEDRSR